MKKKSTSQSAPAQPPAREYFRSSLGESGFVNLRVLLASVICLAGVLIALGGVGLYLGSSKAQAQPGLGSAIPPTGNPGAPDVVRLVGPVRLDQDLRSLPYIPPAPHILNKLLTRFPQPDTGGSTGSQSSAFTQFQSLFEKIFRPAPTMPPPLLTFDGINSAEGSGNPPDTNGDVGPNHYVQSVNDSFKVFDKNGNTLLGRTTLNSFFKPLGSTPCGNNKNEGDVFVFYDQIADRWVITDFAFPKGPPRGNSFWECIGVSQTGDPVAGGWFLYALQHDPANPNRLGDYPKFGLWPDAYYLTMNEYINKTDSGFVGVRVYALDRRSMINGRPMNAVGFTIDLATLGSTYSLVPASFRTGNPPPGREPEFLLAVDSPPDVILTQVKGWLFHVDFANPANSTLGIGANHAPNALITVSAFINAPESIVPQKGTGPRETLYTLGDRIMTPVVYQNRSGTESLWADKTVILNYQNGPTGIRWYQFDVTGGNFPATPVQQQDWTNGNDGLWRWMPSIAVDANGNTAIGYSVSSPSIFPGIRYAGRLASDPLNDLSQGEAIMTNGSGAQTDLPGRWGDYTMTTIDPTDGLSFWHTNEYYPMTAVDDWFTRIGKFQFPAGSPTPTPTGTPRPTPAPRPEPTETPRPSPP
jgi:hypothetical protein